MDSLMQSLAIQPLWLLSQIVGFIILVVLLNKYGLKPLYQILDDRADEIKRTYDQLDVDKASMLKTRQEYESRLAGIEVEARKQIADAVKEAQALRASILADAQKQAEEILDRGRNEAQREREKAFVQMRGDIVDLSIAAAGRVIGESLDASKHRKLVDDFIGSVGGSTIGTA